MNRVSKRTFLGVLFGAPLAALAKPLLPKRVIGIYEALRIAQGKGGYDDGNYCCVMEPPPRQVSLKSETWTVQIETRQLFIESFSDVDYEKIDHAYENP